MIDRPARERPRSIEWANGVDGEKSRRLGRIRFDQRHNGEQRGIVDEDVDRAKPIDGRRDQKLAVVRLGDVGWDRENGLTAFLFDRGGRTRQRVLGAPGDRDPRALTGEREGDRKAYSRAAPGHDCDLAVELTGLVSRRRRHCLPGRQAIDWKRRASALMCFAVSMSRSVIFMPASWVQNEKVRML